MDDPNPVRWTLALWIRHHEAMHAQAEKVLDARLDRLNELRQLVEQLQQGYVSREVFEAKITTVIDSHSVEVVRMEERYSELLKEERVFREGLSRSTTAQRELMSAELADLRGTNREDLGRLTESTLNRQRIQWVINTVIAVFSVVLTAITVLLFHH